MRIRSVRFKKRPIPGDTLVAVARRYGIPPGGEGPVACHYCGEPGTMRWWMGTRGRPMKRIGVMTDRRVDGLTEPMELDHVVPESKGGPSSPENIVVACSHCNRSKGAKSKEAFEAARARCA